MKVIIAGGRDYKFGSEEIKYLDGLMSEIPIKVVICGMARGADIQGKYWADWNHIPVLEFHPDWEMFGKAAGYIRNQVMADNADAVILFPGGKGTQHMKAIAEEVGLKIYEYKPD